MTDRRRCTKTSSGTTEADVVRGDAEVIATLAELEPAGGVAGGREPRRFHAFPARMPLAVAGHLVRRLVGPRGVVLDPMCGSGTTPLAAADAGLAFRGFDRDPLAVLIASCAVTGFDSSDVIERGRRTLAAARVRVARRRAALARFLDGLPREDSEFLRSWYPERSLIELLALREEIEATPPGPVRDFLFVVLSGLIIAKSAGVSYAVDITRSRPHRVASKAVDPPFAVWDARLRQAAKRLPFADRAAPVAGTIEAADARRLPLGDGSVDFVLTSPPYRTAIDYLRSHKFSLVWMGHRLADLRELRGTMIGTERGLWERDGLPDRLERRLATNVPGPADRARLRRYLSDLRRVLGETARVLRPGGLAVFAVGPTLFNAKRTDAAAVVGELAEAAGLAAVAAAVRPLRDFNRSLPPPASADGSASLAGRMRREVFVAVRKPFPGPDGRAADARRG